jgi:hypothetical protein
MVRNQLGFQNNVQMNIKVIYTISDSKDHKDQKTKDKDARSKTKG